MSAAVIVANNLPAQIVALSDEALAESTKLAAQGSGFVVADLASYTQGTALFKQLESLNKLIAAQRLDMTRPIDELKRQVMDAERRATIPLTAAIESLGRRLLDMKRKLEQERAEAERKAREEAEAKARAERERLEAERAAIIKRQQEERAEAERKAAEEAKLFGTVAEEIPEAEPPPPVVVVPVVDAVMIPAELPKSAVRGSTRKVLVVDDPEKIPRILAGVVLLVPDPKAIEKLLKAGVAVPGCRLESVEGFASAGSR